MKSDVAIVGGGPAGSALAMFLLREGIRPLIIEQESFPRYHIGESLTGAGGKVLRDLGLEEEMNRRGHPRKQGAKVFGTNGETTWFVPVTGRDQDWKLFDWHTWQVRRSDFDAMMLGEAIRRGAELLPGKALHPLLNGDGAVRGVQVRPADGGLLDIETELLLDCSGQATWLANLKGITGPKYLGSYDKQIAFFSQVTGAVRDNGTTKETDPDNTLLFYQQKFHWSWFIPLDKEVVSVGVVAPAVYYQGQRESPHDFLARELRTLNPEMAKRYPEMKLVHDVHVIPNYSYQVNRFTGRGFMCIADAHRFVDPIYSFGVTMALREAQFAAPVIKAYLEGHGRDDPHPFAHWERTTERAIDVLEDMLDFFWERPLAFAVFVFRRYTDEMTDLFAGRVFERQPSGPVKAFRRGLEREKERSEDLDQQVYSIPIGSRYHPERAPLWEENAVIESTEAWMGPR